MLGFLSRINLPYKEDDVSCVRLRASSTGAGYPGSAANRLAARAPLSSDIPIPKGVEELVLEPGALAGAYGKPSLKVRAGLRPSITAQAAGY